MFGAPRILNIEHRAANSEHGMFKWYNLLGVQAGTAWEERRNAPWVEFSHRGVLVLTITAKPSNPHSGKPPAHHAALLPQAKHTPPDWPIVR